MKIMHILVTNDDGVNAPGLLALAQEMKKLGKVTVFAPAGKVGIREVIPGGLYAAGASDEGGGGASCAIE